MTIDTKILDFALRGYDYTIAALTSERDALVRRAEAEMAGKPRKVVQPKRAAAARRLSAAARNNIAAAQRKRWKEYRLNKKKPGGLRGSGAYRKTE
jgi:hypothetical protein